jgi:hypothetical protein
MPLPRKKRGERSNSTVALRRWQQIWKLYYKRGWTGRQIARSLNVSHTLVQHYLKKGPPPGWHPDKRPKAPVIDIRRRAGTQQRSDPAS